MDTPALRALIWDVDGTLAETEFNGHRRAFNAAFAEAGLAWDWDEPTYARLLSVTGGKERMMAWWRSVDAAGAAAPDADERVRALHRRKTQLYTERVAAGGVGLRPGIGRLLDEAAAGGLQLAIATTTTLDNVQALLQATLGPTAMDHFSVVGAGDVVADKKPAPDIYEWVLQRLGLPPHECLAIEDSLPGARAALAAGLPTLVLRSRLSRDEAWPDSVRGRLAADPLGPQSTSAAAPRGDTAPVQRADPGAKGITLGMLRQWHAAANRPAPQRPVPLTETTSA